MTSKVIMQNLFKLIARGALPLECFGLYWYYWTRRGDELTQREAAEAIGYIDPKTARKYNQILEAAGLVKFTVTRGRGVSGFIAEPQPVTDNVRRKLTRGKSAQTKTQAVRKIPKIYIALAEYLYNAKRANDESFLAGKNLSRTFQRWGSVLQELVETDKRDIETVKRVIDWCHKTGAGFWAPIIIDADKLRKKFTVLYGQYVRDGVHERGIGKHKRIKNKTFKKKSVKGLLDEL